MKPVQFHESAIAELDDAVTFYEGRAKGLGLDFLEKIRDGVAKIQQNPEAWPLHKKRGGYRKYFPKRFPYTIFYLEMPDVIWIAAVSHSKRRPNYWDSRQQP